MMPRMPLSNLLKLLLWGCLRVRCIVLFHGRTALNHEKLHSNCTESLPTVQWSLKTNDLGMPWGKLYCCMDILTQLTMQSSRMAPFKTRGVCSGISSISASISFYGEMFEWLWSTQFPRQFQLWYAKPGLSCRPTCRIGCRISNTRVFKVDRAQFIFYNCVDFCAAHSPGAKMGTWKCLRVQGFMIDPESIGVLKEIKLGCHDGNLGELFLFE